MDVRRLMRVVDRLSYPDRMARLAELARSLPSGDLRALLDGLADGDAFQRGLALRMAAVAGLPGYVRSLLDDPEPAVQGPAVAIAVRMPEIADAVFASLYEDAPVWLRRTLLRGIRVAGRHELAAALVDVARRRWGDAEAVRLLPACAGEEFQRHLRDLSHLLSVGDWRRLGDTCADAVLSHAELVLPALPVGAVAAHWWETAGWGVATAARKYPERVLALVTRWLPSGILPASVCSALGRLMDADASAVLALLLTPERRRAVLAGAFGTRMLRRMDRLTDDELGRLGRVLWATPRTFAAFLRALPPARREGVFGLATARLDLAQVVLPDAVLDALPHAERHRQARRMLTVRAVRDIDTEIWRVTAHLPFDEAFATFEAAVTRPDAGERAAVYRAVTACAGRSRDVAAVGRLLGWLTRVRNEQDPVRRAVLSGVAALPPSVLDGSHADALGVLVRDAMEARDRSPSTERALAALASTTVVQGALRDDQALLRWGLATHRYISGVTGTLSLAGLCDGLPRGREHALYEAFRPHVEAAVRRDSFWLPLAVAWGFGKRGWAIEPLYRVVERALRSSEAFVVTVAVDLWLADPHRRHERVGALFRRFPRRRALRFARSHAVWRAVSEQRTDLLDRVFADPKPTLRFRDLGAWQVRPSALHRWVPRQHLAYARLLRHVANDSAQPAWTRACAVRTLGRVPGLGRSALGPYLAWDDTRIREAALAALAWTDRPDQVVPTLLATAGSDDARVGMYAVARAARYVRPSRLTTVLGSVLVEPGSKVTSRKEVARLLGELHAPHAVHAFRDAWDDAHRDVRAAMISATAQHLLDQEDAWSLLEAAVREAPAVATVVAGMSPYAVAVRHRERYGELVVSACNHGSRAVVRAALRSLASWAAWAPEGVAVCTRLLLDLLQPSDIWRSAVAALAQFARAGLGVVDLTEAIRVLAAADLDPAAPNAGTERDRPTRQRVAGVVAELTKQALLRPDDIRDALYRVADVLAEEPTYLSTWSAVRIAALDWHAPGADLDDLAERLDTRPVLAAQAAGVLGGTMQRMQAHWTSVAFEPLVPRLAARGVAGGRLAVAITERCGERRKWPEAWRARLRELRTHDDPDVRDAALAVFTAGE